MASIIIHQEKIKNPGDVLKVCPFGAIQYENGVLSISAACKMCKLCVKNGPVGAFEIDQFGKGTEAVGLAVSLSGAFALAGGGDTVAALDKYDIAKDMDYISTAGGAFLEFMEGKTLPAVAALEARAKG